MKYRSRLVEYLNGSSTVKHFDPGVQSVQAGTDQDFTARRDFLRTIWAATSKTVLLGNQLSSHPSALCTDLPRGITVIIPLKAKTWLVTRGVKNLISISRLTFKSLLLATVFLCIENYDFVTSLIQTQDSADVVIDSAEVIRPGEDPIHKSTVHAPLIRN